MGDSRLIAELGFKAARRGVAWDLEVVLGIFDSSVAGHGVDSCSWLHVGRRGSRFNRDKLEMELDVRLCDCGAGVVCCSFCRDCDHEADGSQDEAAPGSCCPTNCRQLASGLPSLDSLLQSTIFNVFLSFFFGVYFHCR